MSLETDLILDRRRLKRRLVFWRSFAVLAVVVALVQFGFAASASSAIVIGIAIGYAICLGLGIVDFASVQRAAAFALPQPLRFGMSFPPSGILAMGLAYVVTMVETTGTFMALGAATETKMRGTLLKRGVLCDGVGSAFASTLGAPPMSTFAQNVGVISLTGVASRHVVALTGVMLALAGLFPVLGAVVVTIPQPVLGGAGLMMFAMIIAAGVQMLSNVEHDKRTGLLIAVSVGCGLAVSVRPELLSKLPSFVHEIFGSGISTAAIVAVILNLVLPDRPVAEHDEDEEDDVPQPMLIPKVG